MGRSKGVMKESFISLKTIAKKMHLQINLAENKINANNYEGLCRRPTLDRN
jgi:ribosomal protein S25